MADFFESYEKGPTGRERFVKWFFWGIAFVILLFGVDWILGKLGRPNLSDFREQWRVRQFFSRLEAKDYEGAYRFWGCEPQNPCRDYRFDKFLEDWGPKSPQADLSRMRTEVIRHCGTGIIQTVRFGEDEPIHLWVNSGDLTLSFAPWPVCNPRIPVP